MDSRKPRDGKYIEQLGVYDPRQEPSVVTIDNERALHWLNTGAQPTERARKLLEISGAWTQFKVARGDIHTVGDAEPAPKAKKPAPKTPKAETPTPVAEAAVVEDPAGDADTTEAAVKEEEE
jgi:small subunit ribosomal protein S16